MGTGTRTRTITARKGRKGPTRSRRGRKEKRRGGTKEGGHCCYEHYRRWNEPRPKPQQPTTDRPRKEAKGFGRKEEATQRRPPHHRKTSRKGCYYAQMVVSVGRGEIRFRICYRSTKI